MINSSDFSHGENCMVKRLNYFYITGCLVVALQIKFAFEGHTAPAHADRKKAQFAQ